MKNWFKTNTDSSPKDKKWWKPNISWLKLDKWVKRLDIYIIKKFLGTYFFAIALIISIAVVFDVNENIDRFINNKAPLKAIVFDYYMNSSPTSPICSAPCLSLSLLSSLLPSWQKTRKSLPCSPPE